MVKSKCKKGELYRNGYCIPDYKNKDVKWLDEKLKGKSLKVGFVYLIIRKKLMTGLQMN